MWTIVSLGIAGGVLLDDFLQNSRFWSTPSIIKRWNVRKSRRVYSCAKWAEKSIYEVSRTIGTLLRVEKLLQRLFRSMIFSSNWATISPKFRKLSYERGIHVFLIENDGQSFSCQLISVSKSFPLHILRYWSSCCQQFQLTWVLNWKMRYARIFGRAFLHYGHVPWHWKCQKSFFHDVFHQSWPYDFFLSSSWDFR